MREKVRKKYAELAVASQRGDAYCCGSSCGCGTQAQEEAILVSGLSRGSYSGEEARRTGTNTKTNKEKR